MIIDEGDEDDGGKTPIHGAKMETNIEISSDEILSGKWAIPMTREVGMELLGPSH